MLMRPTRCQTIDSRALVVILRPNALQAQYPELIRLGNLRTLKEMARAQHPLVEDPGNLPLSALSANANHTRDHLVILVRGVGIPAAAESPARNRPPIGQSPILEIMM
jgi:hypothetical protein